MSQKLPTRTDPPFGEFYAITNDILAVIEMYRKRFDVGYRQAWQDWFTWAMGKG